MQSEPGIEELQEAMSSGRESARSLTEFHLDRIERMDRSGPELRAVLTLNPDARSIADDLDAERRRGAIRGPLHGIPLLIKGNIDTADGMTTTAGSLALSGHIASADAFLVCRLRAAGAVLLGKGNLSEWANFRGRRSVSGWSSEGGQTRNPYALDRSPCGSSSGSAVAVAAGLCVAAVGTETDGSIVCPSHVNGIVGLKPTLGTISRRGIIPIAHSQDTAGPMARSVRDAALLLGALAGEDPRDPPTHIPIAARVMDYARGLGTARLEGVRLGIARDVVPGRTSLNDVLEASIAALRSLGATVVDPVPLNVPDALRASELEVLMHEFKHDVNAYLDNLGPTAAVHSLSQVIEFNQAHREQVMPFFGQEAMIEAETRGPLSSAAYREARATCRRLARDEGIDAIVRTRRLDAVVSLSGGPAWLIDHVHGDYGVAGPSALPAVSGYPHITVPAGFAYGLPIGLSFFGPAYSDAALLRIAGAFEDATRARRQPRYLRRAMSRP